MRRILKIALVSIAGATLIVLASSFFLWSPFYGILNKQTSHRERPQCEIDQRREDPYVRPTYEALIIDADRDGIELESLASTYTYMDFNNNGSATRIAWPRSGDGFLIIEEGQNEQGKPIWQLFSNVNALNGFASLSLLDTNDDGAVDEDDEQFGRMAVWIDRDEDGIQTEEETRRLKDIGLRAISIELVDDSREISENTIVATSKVLWSDGEDSDIANVSLKYASSDAFVVNALSDHKVDPEALVQLFVLPNIRGWGSFPSLWEAMLLDPELRLLVTEFSTGLNKSVEDYERLAEAILHQWAGTGDVAVDSRGCFFNGRRLATLERTWGYPWRQLGRYTNPSKEAAPYMETAWQRNFDYFLLRLYELGPNQEESPFQEIDFKSGKFKVENPDEIIAKWVEFSPSDISAFYGYWRFKLLALSSDDALGTFTRKPVLAPALTALINLSDSGGIENPAEFWPNAVDALADLAKLVPTERDTFLLTALALFNDKELTLAANAVASIVRGNGIWSGGLGINTYAFGPGIGNVEVRNVGLSDRDVIEIVGGMSREDVLLDKSDLNLNIILPSKETLTIVGQFNTSSRTSPIETLRFVDGGRVDLIIAQ